MWYTTVTMCAECSNCWGPGKTFGDIPTPSETQLSLYGIEKGNDWNPGDPEPPNGTYTLSQDPLNPCRFNWSDGTWLIHWWAYQVGGSHLSVELIAIEYAFEDTRAQNCRTYFTNEHTIPAGCKYYGGAAQTYPDWLLNRMTVDYSLMPVENTSDFFYELTEDALVLKLTNRDYHCGLFVKYDDSS